MKHSKKNRGIKELSIEEFHEVIRIAGLPSFRGNQILAWIYAKNVHSYDEMTNIPMSMREQLSYAYPLSVPEVLVKQESSDGSRKYLLRYADGTPVETVGLPSDDNRLTVCCSSQAGCAMACDFCATGKDGFIRDLTPGEIVDQVLSVQEDFQMRVTNVVVMGQGEPFANYNATIDALHIMNHPKLLNIGARHITVSTCGLISGIERFTSESEQFTLAVSLHSCRQEVRDKLMPSMKNQRLGALRQELDHYAQATGRRFSLEYALMKGVNDSEEDLRALKEFCRRLLCHVNLIPLNEIGDSSFKPVSSQKMDAWKDELELSGIPASIRRSRGTDIDAACGQLVALSRK